MTATIIYTTIKLHQTASEFCGLWLMSRPVDSVLPFPFLNPSIGEQMLINHAHVSSVSYQQSPYSVPYCGSGIGSNEWGSIAN